MFFLRCCTFYIRIMNDSDANLCRSKPIMIRSFAHVCIKTALLTSYHSKFRNIKVFWKVEKRRRKLRYIMMNLCTKNQFYLERHFDSQSSVVQIQSNNTNFHLYQPCLWWCCKLIRYKATLYKLGFFFYYI